MIVFKTKNIEQNSYISLYKKNNKKKKNFSIKSFYFDEILIITLLIKNISI
jgi:hypothetical protein